MSVDTRLQLAVGQALAMTEKHVQQAVNRLARDTGWLWYHTAFSVGSKAGFPDCFGLNAEQGGRVIARELKVLGKHPTAEQEVWLAGLRQAGIDAALWTSLDLITGRVAAELRGVPFACPYSLEPDDVLQAMKDVRALRRSPLTAGPRR